MRRIGAVALLALLAGCPDGTSSLPAVPPASPPAPVATTVATPPPPPRLPPPPLSPAEAASVERGFATQLVEAFTAGCIEEIDRRVIERAWLRPELRTRATDTDAALASELRAAVKTGAAGSTLYAAYRALLAPDGPEVDRRAAASALLQDETVSLARRLAIADLLHQRAEGRDRGPSAELAPKLAELQKEREKARDEANATVADLVKKPASADSAARVRELGDARRKADEELLRLGALNKLLSGRRAAPQPPLELPPTP